MTDTYKNHSSGLSDPILSAQTVVPSDTNDLSIATRALYVGSSGNLRVSLVSGDIVTFSNVPVGWHPLRTVRVWATGTTAASIVSCS